MEVCSFLIAFSAWHLNAAVFMIASICFPPKKNTSFVLIYIYSDMGMMRELCDMTWWLKWRTLSCDCNCFLHIFQIMFELKTHHITHAISPEHIFTSWASSTHYNATSFAFSIFFETRKRNFLVFLKFFFCFVLYVSRLLLNIFLFYFTFFHRVFFSLLNFIRSVPVCAHFCRQHESLFTRQKFVLITFL